jgi:transposase-like protein
MTEATVTVNCPHCESEQTVSGPKKKVINCKCEKCNTQFTTIIKRKSKRYESVKTLCEEEVEEE